jgi:hypothetical protein
MTPRTVGCDMMLTEEEVDGKWEDRASLGTLNAFDGVYMSSQAALCSRAFMTGVSAGELEEGA